MVLDVRAKVNSFDGIGVVSKGLSRPEHFTRMKEFQLMITKLLCLQAQFLGILFRSTNSSEIQCIAQGKHHILDLIMSQEFDTIFLKTFTTKQCTLSLLF